MPASQWNGVSSGTPWNGRHFGSGDFPPPGQFRPGMAMPMAGSMPTHMRVRPPAPFTMMQNVPGGAPYGATGQPDLVRQAQQARLASDNQRRAQADGKLRQFSQGQNSVGPSGSRNPVRSQFGVPGSSYSPPTQYSASDNHHAENREYLSTTTPHQQPAAKQSPRLVTFSDGRDAEHSNPSPRFRHDVRTMVKSPGARNDHDRDNTSASQQSRDYASGSRETLGHSSPYSHARTGARDVVVHHHDSRNDSSHHSPEQTSQDLQATEHSSAYRHGRRDAQAIAAVSGLRHHHDGEHASGHRQGRRAARADVVTLELPKPDGKPLQRSPSDLQLERELAEVGVCGE